MKPIYITLFVLLIVMAFCIQSIIAASDSQLVFRIRIAIVLAGIDESPALKPFYIIPVDAYHTLNISITIKHIESSKISKALRETMHINTTIPEFVQKYLEAQHPNWRIRFVEWIRADEAELALYHQLQNLTKGFDYVLLLFYLPPPSGYVRVYYISRYVPELQRVIGFSGLIGFGGNTPLYFIDLSAIPSYHPSKEQPLYMYGTHFNYTNNPPLWDLPSPTARVELLTRYAQRFVGFLVARDLFHKRLPWRPWYVVNITIVDFSGGKAAERALRLLNKTKLLHYLRSLDPLIMWHVEVYTISNGNATPFRIAIEKSLQFGKFVVLQYRYLYGLARNRSIDVVRITPVSVVIPVYIFVHSAPLHMTFNHGALNFTGCATDLAVFFTIPGYAYRVYMEGLNIGIAHEIGHELGLHHPFEGVDPGTGRNAVDWSMDFVASPMSYAPTVAGWRGSVFYYDARALCRAQIAQLVEFAKSIGITTPRGALFHAQRGECLDVGMRIIHSLFSEVPSPHTLLKTVTRMNTLTLYRTVASMQIVTETRRLTMTSTETLTKTVVLVTTSTTTITTVMQRIEVLNSTVTVFRKAVPSNFAALTAIMLLVGLGIGVALGRRKT